MTRRLIVSDGQARRELLLESTLTVGRDPECEISHADPRLSRRHAEFVPTPEGVVVRDLASRNGVKVNGKNAHEALLHAGDLVEVGVLALQLVDDEMLPTIGRAASPPIMTPGPHVQLAPDIEDDRTRIVPQRQMAPRPAARLAPTVIDIGDVVLHDANGAASGSAVRSGSRFDAHGPAARDGARDRRVRGAGDPGVSGGVRAPGALAVAGTRQCGDGNSRVAGRVAPCGTGSGGPRRPADRARRAESGSLNVARLIVLHDQMLHRYVDLGWRQLKIGRGPQNDIVLDDPEKAVSRFHAEVRREGDDYVLIDLNSQNGTWMDAQRIDRVVLRVGVPVAIGPFLLVLDGGSGAR